MVLYTAAYTYMLKKIYVSSLLNQRDVPSFSSHLLQRGYSYFNASFWKDKFGVVDQFKVQKFRLENEWQSLGPSLHLLHVYMVVGWE